MQLGYRLYPLLNYNILSCLGQRTINDLFGFVVLAKLLIR